MPGSTFSRRRFLKTTALTAASTLAAPYMRTAHSAGRLRLGCWDHWVPGANDTLTAICKEWGAKNHVEGHIDYITSVGDKDILTASAQALAKAGHDIMQHRDWRGGRRRAAVHAGVAG